MRHIKLFEGFDKSEYYTNITEDEYDRLLCPGDDIDNKEVFTKSEVDFFRSLEMVEVDHWSKVSSWSNDNMDTIEFDESFKVALRLEDEGFNIIYITKIVDDYFIVKSLVFGAFTITFGRLNTCKSRGELYKCDQWEGLMELLRDKEVIK
jgi:hypothetical protein